MGWGRWLLLGDLGQQMDLADHQAEIDNLKEELRSIPDFWTGCGCDTLRGEVSNQMNWQDAMMKSRT